MPGTLAFTRVSPAMVVSIREMRGEDIRFCHKALRLLDYSLW